MDERALIDAARAGKRGASAFLVSSFGPQLLSYCRSLTPELSDADREMICETAIETAVRKIDEYDDSRSFARWLRGFVFNTARNWGRGQGLRHRDSVDLLVDLAAPPLLSEQQPPSAAAQELAAAVLALPELDRLYLHLRFADGLPTKEIAVLLGKTDAAVRQRLSRIQRSLAAQITV